MVSSHEVGVIGMATMGKGVARNLARKGFKIAIQSRNYEKALQFYESLSGTEKQNMTLYRDLEDFVMSLSRPRKIMMLVKAGASTDELIFKLLPLLSPGDILMDLGNSFYGDTDRRMAELESRGIHFMGIGISGGEKGALNGPSVMPEGRWTPGMQCHIFSMLFPQIILSRGNVVAISAPEAPGICKE